MQKRITFCRSIYVKKVMKLVVFIIEHPSYISENFIEIQYACLGLKVPKTNSFTSTLCILVDFSHTSNAIRMGLSIIYLKGSQVDMS